MGIIMVAMLAFGGTFALFTAEASAQTGNFTTGHVHLTSNFSTLTFGGSKVVPGQAVVTGNIAVTPDNLGTATTMAVKISFRTKAKGAAETEWSAPASDLAVLNLTGDNAVLDTAWKYDSTNGIYVYGNGTTATPVEDGATSAINFTNGNLVFTADSHSTNGTDQEDGWMDKDVQIIVSAVSRQVVANETYADTVSALAALFN